MFLLDHPVVLVFLSRSKYVRGREAKDEDGRRERRIIIMQLPSFLLEPASGSHNFFWQKQLSECKWESFVEKPLASGHYNRTVSGDLVVSLS